MRIAHVVATFPPHLGGMGQVAFDECRMLAKKGHEVEVFTMHYFDFTYPKNTEPFKVTRLTPFIKSGDAGFTPRLAWKLRSFDIVHLHYPWYGGAEWVLLARFFNKQKYIVTYHMDAAPTTALRRFVQRVYDSIYAKHIFKNAEKVVTVHSEYFLKTRFAPAIEVGKLVELQNPVDTDIFNTNRTVQFPVRLPPEWSKKKIVLFVGNLLPVKRLDLLVRAMAHIKDPEAVLVVVGGGYAEATYRALAKEVGVAEKVAFVGPIDNRDELVSYYRFAHVTVIPSDSESFSLVKIEAAACGCPIVVRNVPLEKTAITFGVKPVKVEPGADESLLAASVESVLHMTPTKKNEQVQSAELVKNAYGLSKHVSALEQIYHEVA